MATSNDWPDALVQRLRELWDEGHSAAEIGRRIGRSKNGVVGKAHRLELPERPSPIIKSGERRVHRAKPQAVGSRSTLPPLTAPKLEPQQAASLALRPAAVPVSRTPATARALPTNFASHSFPPGRACCFPIGELRTPGFRFCEADVETPGPYCDAHRKVCYAGYRWREPDDDAPALVFVAGKRVVTDEGRRRISEGMMRGRTDAPASAVAAE